MLFSQPTENEINNNICAVTYGGMVSLSARAYTEILTAARNYQAIVRGSARAEHYQQSSSVSTSGYIKVVSDGAVKVCPHKDTECSDRPSNWCDSCPKRG